MKSYPNIKIVSRDGSIIYKKAITLAHPTAIQISDRFHILKNLTSYCREYLLKLFKAKVKMTLATSESSCPIDTMLLKEEKVKQIIQLTNDGVKVSHICKQLKIDIRTLKKVLKMNDMELENYTKTKKERERSARLTKKQQLIDDVRSAYSKCQNKSHVARLFNLNYKTVSKYLSTSVTPINGNTHVKRKSILDKFLPEIHAKVHDGMKSPYIEASLRQQGYKGSSSTLRHYISDYKKSQRQLVLDNENEDGNCYWIERNLLIKLLFKPLSKIPQLNELSIQHVNNQYPMFEQIIKLVYDFRTLVKERHVHLLDNWLRDALSLNIKEINSFIEGVSRDLLAVKNAIQFEYNNGLAEGSVNKLKVIKRIMYGCNSFKLLRNKLLYIE